MITRSPDAQAILLVCSSLAKTRDSTTKPLAPKEYHQLTVALRQKDASPRSLLGLEASALAQAYGITPVLAERIAALAARGGHLAVALDRLASLGIWPVTRADDAYPQRFKERLRGAAPPVLFGAGDHTMLQNDALAVIGSRDVGEVGAQAAEALGRACAREHVVLVSGGARGVDAMAMAATVESGGLAVGVLADSLERAVSRRDFRAPLSDGSLLLLTATNPAAGFSVGAAMGRNKLVYTLADAAVVVASAAERGGTWTGAVENLRHDWVPLHVLDDGSDGPTRLIERGGTRLGPDEVAATVVRHLFKRQESVAPPVTTRPAVLTESARPVMRRADSSDLFELVWPKLDEFLSEPRTERDVAANFGLQASQARAWLKHATAERLIEKLSKPVRYQRVTATADKLFADEAPSSVRSA